MAKTNPRGSNPRPCNFRAVSDSGKPLYGTAAFLKIASDNGGIDNHLRLLMNRAITLTLNMAAQQGHQRKLR